MYQEFLKGILTYVDALNTATRALDEGDGLTPYLGDVEVMLEGELVGYLRDEIGGSWSYFEVRHSGNDGPS